MVDSDGQLNVGYTVHVFIATMVTQTRHDDIILTSTLCALLSVKPGDTQSNH